jgi:RNA polymerase sigma factor (sigma-70 family)
VTPQAEFAALYERHHKALYRYCRSIVRHEEDAQDALQSTLTRAYAALQDRPHDFDLRPWLFRIAHNESVSILRRRRPTLELDAELAALGGVDERAELQETLRIFRQDLADLPERQRSVLVLRELNGLRPAEIAELLDTTPGAVKQTLLEARRALARCNEGRETPCFDVQRALMEGDGRVLRGRSLRAHLRSCTACRRFRADVKRRRFGLLAGLLGALQGSGLFAKTALVAVVAVTATAEVRTLQEPKHARPVPVATPTATPTVVVKPARALATATPQPRPRPLASAAPSRPAKHPAARAKRAHRHATHRPAAKPAPTPAATPVTTHRPAKHEAKQPKQHAIPPGQAKKQKPAATPTPAPPKHEDKAAARLEKQQERAAAKAERQQAKVEKHAGKT